MEEKRVLCASCDIACSVIAEVEDGKVLRVKASDDRELRANICMKGIHAPKGFGHKDRVLFPLRRKGERGSGEWERVSWDDAMDDIAERLQTVVDRHGPEALAVSTSQWNTSVENGSGRRFMNLLGSPNWISGVALCAGNTAAVNRMVYGWFPFPDFNNTRCIVLFGHNPRRHSWTPIYNSIRRAQKRGAKLIVLDPRRSENAEQADLWLPLRAGTDAAMCFGWLNVIFEEGLYDSAFVEKWTTGFDAFRERVAEFPLDRVADITGVEPDLIARAARMYATETPGVIPWTPITDQQRNSTSAIRLHSALRAVTGNLDVEGGEVLHGFHPDVISESSLELHGALTDEQRAKQLGAATHPAFTYRGTAALAEPTERVWGQRWANIVMGSYMATPSATFRAMAHGDPYAVKAFILLGNNPLLSYANMPLIYKAMMNQDLVVAFEQFKTPSAQIADYILPGDSWLERPNLSDAYGWTAIYRASQQAVEPPGECRSVYDFWRELAVRMGFREHFPWKSVEEVLDYRLTGLGKSFREFSTEDGIAIPEMRFRKYEDVGFATPSGKVELHSSILEDLGFDPLPYWREDPVDDDRFPLRCFTGVREDPFFQTGHRHIDELRRVSPEPELYINPEEAAAWDISTGEWVEVESAIGTVEMRVNARDDMPRGLVRIPHGWWRPEAPQGKDNLSDAWKLADAQLCPDDEDFLDREQGIPHFKGIPCRINKRAHGAAAG